MLKDENGTVSAGLTAFFDDSDDSVVSFAIQGSARNPAPVLYGKESAGKGRVRRKVGQLGYLEDVPLLIDYAPDTDTLRLWNGREVAKTQAVADSLVAEFDGEGEVIGLTLEQAAGQLRPFLCTTSGVSRRRLQIQTAQARPSSSIDISQPHKATALSKCVPTLSRFIKSIR